MQQKSRNREHAKKVERFAESDHQKNFHTPIRRPEYGVGPQQKLKHICITCFKNETFHHSSKFCTDCQSKQPKFECSQCHVEFHSIKKLDFCHECYWKNRKEKFDSVKVGSPKHQVWTGTAWRPATKEESDES